jgi:hypothetical protein
MSDAPVLRADELFEKLRGAGIEFVIIGGFAVNIHGYVRATKDIVVVPDPNYPNLVRLASLLTELNAEQIGVDAHLLPDQPTDPDGLAEGGSFQLNTSLGRLDILQEGASIPSYARLAATAIEVPFRDQTLKFCSLEELREMKRAAGRPDDLRDLEKLAEAHGDASP